MQTGKSKLQSAVWKYYVHVYSICGDVKEVGFNYKVDAFSYANGAFLKTFVYKVKVWNGLPGKPNDPNAEGLILHLV